jgi:hypothetical protein
MSQISISSKLSSNDLADLFFGLEGLSERRLARVVEHTDFPARAVIRAAAVRHAENWVRETFPGRPVPKLRPEDVDPIPNEDEDD